MLDDHKKLELILSHIRHVEENTLIIAKALLTERKSFALKLIQRGRDHDISKFSLFEFDHLWKDDEMFSSALNQHHNVNEHHPEFFDRKGIHSMKEIDVAEMVCDCTARAQEFGTDIRKWFFTTAAKKYEFSEDDTVGRQITYFLNILLTPAFS